MTEDLLTATVSMRAVLVGPDDRVLLVRRTSDGEWEFPGGRLGAHEAVRAGLRRELTEEIDLDITIGQPVHSNTWRNDADQGRLAIYYACETTDRPVSLSAEHTAFDWLTPSEATARLEDPQTTAVERVVSPEHELLESESAGKQSVPDRI